MLLLPPPPLLTDLQEEDEDEDEAGAEEHEDGRTKWILGGGPLDKSMAEQLLEAALSREDALTGSGVPRLTVRSMGVPEVSGSVKEDVLTEREQTALPPPRSSPRSNRPPSRQVAS